MLSDRLRWLMIPAWVVALIGIMAYWTWSSLFRPEGYWAAVAEPERWDGDLVVITLFEVQHIVDDRHFVVRKGNRAALVEGDSAGLMVGDDISVGGKFRAFDLHIVEEWREVHALRPGKRLLGLAALGFLTAMAPIWFTVRDRRIVERGCPTRNRV